MNPGVARRRKRLPRATRRAVPIDGGVATGQRVRRAVSETSLAGFAIPLPRLAVGLPGAFATGQTADFISFNDAARFGHCVLGSSEKANAFPSTDQSLLHFLHPMKSCGAT